MTAAAVLAMFQAHLNIIRPLAAATCERTIKVCVINCFPDVWCCVVSPGLRDMGENLGRRRHGRFGERAEDVHRVEGDCLGLRSEREAKEQGTSKCAIIHT
jgi:hypothetical protein